MDSIPINSTLRQTFKGRPIRILAKLSQLQPGKSIFQDKNLFDVDLALDDEEEAKCNIEWLEGHYYVLFGMIQDDLSIRAQSATDIGEQAGM